MNERKTPPLPNDPWSIGILSGPQPWNLSPPPGLTNPVLTRSQVSDCVARFIADPFMIRRRDRWYLFFEILDHHQDKGLIGMASSDDGLKWAYEGIVLEEPFHLSYPFVFQHGNTIYMVPETLGAGAVRLYRARPFPGSWEHVADLIDSPLADVTPLCHENRWWLFACATPHRHDSLVVYYADQLEGSYQPHRANPIIGGDPTRTRPAGRMIAHGGVLLRFAQDCGPRYGHGVRGFGITHLTPDAYQEKELQASPILAPGPLAWHGRGMHHLDLHRLEDGSFIACVDGHRQPGN